MKKSLKVKLSVTGVCLIVLFVGLNILFTYFWMSPFSMRLMANQMEKLADLIKSQMDLPEEEFQSYIEQIDEDYNTTVTVFDSNKKIIATTSAARARANKVGKITEWLYDENINLLDSGKPVRYFKEKSEVQNNNEATQQTEKTVSKNGKSRISDSEPVRIIMLKKISDDQYVVLHRTFKSFYNATLSAILFDTLAGSIIIVLGILVVWKLSDYVVKPVKEITEVAEHIANLEFDMKVPQNGQDEIGQLGSSINRMSEYLEHSLLQLKEDIDNRKKLVRNLSHEIKSPVAVIMGYSDRMKAIIKRNPDKAIEYCEIISNESNRIDILVKEMLDFSKLEQRMDSLNLETIIIKQMLEKIAVRVREENVDRAFSIQVQCDDDIIVADYGLLERAVYNLVNNAVNYGAVTKLVITMKGERQKDQFMIWIHNTGSHISEEELPYIWNVFYKVDKARVRNKNGCGVGLSIVREIVEAHMGSYEAGNDESGVYFSITIPCNQD
ncbi:MAG: HAMP domain-containing histidine kinase [Lachnospiraceae bacterium]|nr:HAMP domain-containing histidine kinase [Lachnospiraceae bacterium]